MEISVIVTVLNEEASVEPLVKALVGQSLKPAEIIIIDGGSSDKTVEALKKLSAKFPMLKVFSKKGNRSKGRNLAIKKSRSVWIAITDAGCVPNQDWLEQLIKQARSSKSQVIAGYYRAIAKTNFQKAVTPYALVMPDRVNEDTFLPATRSMLIQRQTFDKVGLFDENLSDNEDYAFAIKMKKSGVKMSFTRKAIVNWHPPETIQQFAKMIFRFARGDVQAKIFRPKVALIFLRYLVALLLIGWLVVHQDYGVALFYTILGLGLYSGWAITKNIKYARNGWYWLPIFQLISDLAVMLGSLVGLAKSA